MVSAKSPAICAEELLQLFLRWGKFYQNWKLSTSVIILDYANTKGDKKYRWENGKKISVKPQVKHADETGFLKFFERFWTLKISLLTVFEFLPQYPTIKVDITCQYQTQC